MSLPDLLSDTVGDESVVAEVPLGGDDRLVVTQTRTLVYRGDGLLSDESVTEYAHDVERIALSTGRRKTKLTLSYGLDGDETIAVPTNRIDDVLHPILAGVLSARGVTDAGESVLRTFRFSELTLVVTSDRLVKHVGSSVWDEEFEEFAYADLTALDFEEGTVATAVVLAHDGRSERFKAPNESARAVRETLVDAVCTYHDVESLAEFRHTIDDADDAAADEDTSAQSRTDFGAGPDPLSASPVADAEAEQTDPLAGDTPADSSMELSSDTLGSTETTDSKATETTDATTTGTTDATAAETTDSVATTPTDTKAAAGSETTDAGTADSGGTDAGSTDTGATDSGPTGPEATDPAAEADPLAADDVAGEGIEADTSPSARTATSTQQPTESTATDDPRSATSDDPTPAADVSPASGDGSDRQLEATATETDAFDASPFESAGIEDADLATEVAALRRTVEAQSERLDRQSALIKQLIEELRRGR